MTINDIPSNSDWRKELSAGVEKTNYNQSYASWKFVGPKLASFESEFLASGRYEIKTQYLFAQVDDEWQLIGYNLKQGEVDFNDLHEEDIESLKTVSLEEYMTIKEEAFDDFLTKFISDSDFRKERSDDVMSAYYDIENGRKNVAWETYKFDPSYFSHAKPAEYVNNWRELFTPFEKVYSEGNSMKRKWEYKGDEMCSYLIEDTQYYFTVTEKYLFRKESGKWRLIYYCSFAS